MEYINFSILLTGLALLIAIIVCYIFNKNYIHYSNLILPIIKSLLSVLKAVGAIPGLDKTALNTIISVFSSAIEAAGYAETLWLQGEIEKSARAQHANQYILLLLTSAGIDITDNIRTIINGAIALTCFLMPHYSNKEE